MEERPRIFTKCTPALLVSNRRGPVNTREPFYVYQYQCWKLFAFCEEVLYVVTKELLIRTENLKSEGNKFMSPS